MHQRCDALPSPTSEAPTPKEHALHALCCAQDSDDIRFMVGALKELGVELGEDWPSSKLTVHGCGGAFPSNGAELSLGNAGTAMRPLTAAVAAAGRGEFVLDGVARMRERPIQDLVDGLVQLGAPLGCDSDDRADMQH
jgi:3-phosphoshikimate 1-carboxyvinyltransferase